MSQTLITVLLLASLSPACSTDDNGVNPPVINGSASPRHVWSQRFGLAGFDGGRAIAVDGDGNILVTGSFRGAVDFGGGPLTPSAGVSDIFVAKYNASGTHLWSRGFGGNSSDVGLGIAVDGAGNILVIGQFQGTADFGGGTLNSAGVEDVFVAKYDASGTHLWSLGFGGGSTDTGSGIAVDGSGNVLVIGRFQGTADFGGGPLTSGGLHDIFVAKFNASGTHLWSQRFGGIGLQDDGRGVAVDAADNVLITGLFEGTVDFGGGPLTNSFRKIFVAKYDPSGAHLWSQGFGDGNESSGISAAVDGAGNVLVTGYLQGTVDFGGGPLTSAGFHDIFVVKFSASGTHLWSKRFGGRGAQDDGCGIAVDAAGNVLVTGKFAGAVDFGGGPLTSAGSSNDIFVAKYDPNGDHLWSQHFGDTFFADGGFGIGVDGASNVVVTGRFNGTVDFGGEPLTSAGFHDIFVANFSDE